MLTQAQRQNLLRALNVDVYVRREQAGADDATNESRSNRLTIVCDTNTNHPRLRADLLLALGLLEANVAWLSVTENNVIAAPAATTPAWLVLGENLMPPLTAHLSHHPDINPIIAIAPNVSAIRGNATLKRKLWQTLKPLVRHLRG